MTSTVDQDAFDHDEAMFGPQETSTDELIAHVQRLADAAQRSIDAVAEHAARWHRSVDRTAAVLAAGGDASDFEAGMREAHIQAISLLTGTAVKDIRAQLTAGTL